MHTHISTATNIVVPPLGHVLDDTDYFDVLVADFEDRQNLVPQECVLHWGDL